MRQTTPEQAANIMHQPIITCSQLGGRDANEVNITKKAIAKKEAEYPAR
jgi:hypothetical protein